MSNITPIRMKDGRLFYGDSPVLGNDFSSGFFVDLVRSGGGSNGEVVFEFRNREQMTDGRGRVRRLVALGHTSGSMLNEPRLYVRRIYEDYDESLGIKFTRNRVAIAQRSSSLSGRPLSFNRDQLYLVNPTIDPFLGTRIEARIGSHGIACSITRHPFVVVRRQASVILCFGASGLWVNRNFVDII